MLRRTFAWALILGGVAWLAWYAWNAYSWYRLVGAFGGPVEISFSGNVKDYLPLLAASALTCVGVFLLRLRGAVA